MGNTRIMEKCLKDFVVVELVHKMTQIGSSTLLNGLFHEISDLQLAIRNQSWFQGK